MGGRVYIHIFPFFYYFVFFFVVVAVFYCTNNFLVLFLYIAFVVKIFKKEIKD